MEKVQRLVGHIIDDADHITETFRLLWKDMGYYSPAEAAMVSKMNEQTIYHHLRTHPAELGARKIGRRWFIDKEALDKWLKTRKDS